MLTAVMCFNVIASESMLNAMTLVRDPDQSTASMKYWSYLFADTSLDSYASAVWSNLCISAWHAYWNHFTHWSDTVGCQLCLSFSLLQGIQCVKQVCYQL